MKRNKINNNHLQFFIWLNLKYNSWEIMEITLKIYNSLRSRIKTWEGLIINNSLKINRNILTGFPDERFSNLIEKTPTSGHKPFMRLSSPVLIFHHENCVCLWVWMKIDSFLIMSFYQCWKCLIVRKSKEIQSHRTMLREKSMKYWI